jgi:hypothetical protein
MTDIIGDIHGHAAELKQLLWQLGYSVKNGAYQHPDRTVVFVGDYIDRGPQIPETLRIVRNMVMEGSAIALMGNHEYNALCFHTKKKDGGHLRDHSIKNIHQHYETLRQFQNKQDEYNEYIGWFKSLPLFYEDEVRKFRVVHACWDQNRISFLRSVLDNGKLNEDTLFKSTIKDTPLYIAVDETLKGKEICLPGERTFKDKDGNFRKEIRIRWWEDPSQSSYSKLSVIEEPGLPEEVAALSDPYSAYPLSAKPVFFGHYWLQKTPFLYRDNVCCVDYSVAKGGDLVCYSFNNEDKLNEKNFTIVPSYHSARH